MTAPIFLVGASRSGKTLMRSILSEHPYIAVTRRTDMWPRFYGRFGDLSRPENFARCLRAMLERKQIAALDIDVATLRRDFVRGGQTYARLFELMNQQFVGRTGKRRWLDQTARVDQFADKVIASYSGTRVLHMVRDPRDCLAALVKGSGAARSTLGRFTREWVAAAACATRNLRRHGDAYLVVRYEALVASPATTVRGVCEAIGETFQPSMLELENAGRYRETPSQTESPISRAFVGTYRDILSRREVDHVQAVAARHMRGYGYAIDDTEPVSPRERVRVALTDWPVVAARAIRHAGARS